MKAFCIPGLLLMAACAGTPVGDHYYSLVLASDDGGAVEPADPGAGQVIVGPVVLPDYLQQRGFVMQTGENEIRPANHHFWAEPLDDAVTKVLVRDLARQNASLTINRDAGSWTVSADCRIRVEFDRFHATDRGQVVGSGRYWIASQENMLQHEFAVTRPLTADGHAHAVTTLRDALSEVAEQIGSHLAQADACNGETD